MFGLKFGMQGLNQKQKSSNIKIKITQQKYKTQLSQKNEKKNLLPSKNNGGFDCFFFIMSLLNWKTVLGQIDEK